MFKRPVSLPLSLSLSHSLCLSVCLSVSLSPYTNTSYAQFIIIISYLMSPQPAISLQLHASWPS